MKPGKSKRKEERKFKRLEVRFGPEKPQHRGFAIQVSTTGAFLAANRPIYAPDSRIVIELTIPSGTVVTGAVVRHAKSLPPEMARLSRSGMGVEFVSPPPELVEFLSSL